MYRLARPTQPVKGLDSNCLGIIIGGSTKEPAMTDFTVHFQKGSRVGARSLHMVHVEAETVKDAIRRIGQ